MRVLITGAAGFVGLNVVAALEEARHEVHAYVRGTSRTEYLRRMAVRLHEGELGDAARLADLMAGVDAVVHCAGNTSCYEHDRAALEETNVEGTRAVVNAAVCARVKRFVYTSTTSTVGADDDPRRAWNEDTPLVGFRAASPYGRTKAEAERIVLGAAARGLQSVILNPAEVIGAWDHSLQWGRMVLAVATNRIPFVPPGSATFCSAREVARAHVAALTRGEPGRRYILGGTDATYRELIAQIAHVTGVMPFLPAGPYEVHQARAEATLAGGELPLVDPYRMRVFAGHYRFDTSRAIRELGYRVFPLRHMIRDAYRWYLANGFLAAEETSHPRALAS